MGVIIVAKQSAPCRRGNADTTLTSSPPKEANVAVATLPNLLLAAQSVETPNDVLIERFVTYLTVEKGRGPHTISAYRCDLIQLSRFLGGRDFVTTQCQDLRDYGGHLLSTVTAR